MTENRVFSAPIPERGRDAAVQWAGKRTSGVPDSVLYLKPPSVEDHTIENQWDAYGSRIELRLDSFRDLVDELYEADTYNGSSLFITDAERRWLVEEALRRIDDPEHPLYSADDPPVGLIEQAEELLSLLEFAGAITAADVEQRLQEEGIADLGGSLSTFVSHVHEVRDDVFSSEKTFRSERFQHVLECGPPLVESELPTTDVVIVGSFQTISPLERDLIELLASVIDTGVVLTRVTETESPSGADDAIQRIHSWYDNLGFKHGSGTDTSSSQSTREIAAAALYQYDEGQTETLSVGSDVSVETHTTVQHEVRAIARQIRSLIGDGVDPETIVVAPFDENTYGARITDALAEADVPVTFRMTRPFFATTTGKLFEAAMNLGAEPDRQAPLIRLLSNPLVYPDDQALTEAILQQAELLESTRVATLTEHVNADADTLISDIIEACEEFVKATDIDAARENLFRVLDVPTHDSGTTLVNSVEFARPVCAREEQALTEVAEVCEALTTLRRTSGKSGSESEDDVEDVRRALEQISIATPTGRDSNSVRVCSPTDAVANPTAHVFVPGLTTEHTPSPPRRLAFARPLNNAHPDFEAADPVAGTRYAVGQFLASNAAVTFTAPERNANGDPYVLADVLVELERTTELEPRSGADELAGPASYTDVHRELAVATNTGSITVEEIQANAHAYDIDVPNTNASTRLPDGVKVAAERASEQLGAHDGHIAPDVVTELRDENQPFSPSRLETYASCGFKYYLKYILGIESDDEITLELNAPDAGTYIHDVLEHFYREWRSRGNDAVTDATLNDAQTVLYEVADERLDELDTRDTVFHRAWVTALFDGLDVPENQHGDADGPDGLFKRFLEAEATLEPRNVVPSYFEAHVGLQPDEPGPEVISETPIQIPGTDVQIHGKIDRLDITPDGGLVGIDYKTGSTPSESDTIDGDAFQLPAYLLMAEAALNGTAIGASYYQVKPTSSISPHAGTIGGDEDAAHALYGKGDSEPLRRYRSLAFETRDEFTDFLHETVPDRIKQISNAIENGSFHPTVRGADAAKCEYCSYRDACDVRHHRRHELYDHLNETNTPQYAPDLNTEEPQ